MRHRLEERPEHLAALVADVAHHLQLLVDDHEELVDLLLVGQELQQPLLAGPRVGEALEPEGAADRVHPDVTTVYRHVPLGARPDEVAVPGEEAEGPVGAALALQQPAEHRQRLAGGPVVDLGPVVPADDEVRALPVADLVADDGVHHDAVLLVRGVEAAPVGERDLLARQRLDELAQRHLGLEVDVHDHQGRAVVVGVEPALADLPERDRQQPVETSTVLGHPLLQGYVDQPLDLTPTTAHEGHRGRVPQPDRRPRLVPLQRLQCGPGVEVGAHERDPTSRRFRRPGAFGGRDIGASGC
jgi:hypothetical protein